MKKSLAFSRWLVLVLVIATLIAPLASPGLLGFNASQPAALAQNDQGDSAAGTPDTTGSEPQSEQAPTPDSGAPNGEPADSGEEGTAGTGETV